jgi:hypothetical protein
MAERKGSKKLGAGNPASLSMYFSSSRSSCDFSREGNTAQPYTSVLSAGSV